MSKSWQRCCICKNMSVFIHTKSFHQNINWSILAAFRSPTGMVCCSRTCLMRSSLQRLYFSRLTSHNTQLANPSTDVSFLLYTHLKQTAVRTYLLQWIARLSHQLQIASYLSLPQFPSQRGMLRILP